MLDEINPWPAGRAVNTVVNRGYLRAIIPMSPAHPTRSAYRSRSGDIAILGQEVPRRQSWPKLQTAG